MALEEVAVAQRITRSVTTRIKTAKKLHILGSSRQPLAQLRRLSEAPMTSSCCNHLLHEVPGVTDCKAKYSRKLGRNLRPVSRVLRFFPGEAQQVLAACPSQSLTVILAASKQHRDEPCSNHESLDRTDNLGHTAVWLALPVLSRSEELTSSCVHHCKSSRYSRATRAPQLVPPAPPCGRAASCQARSPMRHMLCRSAACLSPERCSVQRCIFLAAYLRRP